MLTLYRSSAGAGKTYTLTLQYVMMLLKARRKNAHRTILAVTFTKKATAEMKERILQELSLLARGEKSAYEPTLLQEFGYSREQLQAEAKTLLADLLQDYSSFAVTTIDSFFQQIIRSFARELNLQGAYEVELDSKHILQTAVDDYFYNLPDNIDRELLQIVGDNIDEGKQWNPKKTILSLAQELLKEVYQQNKEAIEQVLQEDDSIPRYRHELKQAETDYIEHFHHLQEEARRAADTADLQTISRANDVLAPFYYSDAQLADFLKAPKALASFRKLVSDPQLVVKKGQNPDSAYRLQPFAQKLDTMLFGEPARQVRTARAIQHYLSYLRVIWAVSHYIDAANKELNRLPLAETNKLLAQVVSAQEESPFVYDKIGTRIMHYMIDEAQDTSLMQWHNFRPLLAETSARGMDSLLVGDVKQAIYRWRNSDLYLLQTGVQHDFPHLTDRNLPSNWRSSRQVVEFNNAIFQQLAHIAQDEYNKRRAEASQPMAEQEIEAVYQQVVQLPQKAADGQVFLHFIAAEKAQERHQKILQLLPQHLYQLHERGIALGKVAILVRYNYEAVEIAQALLQTGIKVTSSEALLLTASPQVRLLVLLLRQQLDPDDKTLQLQTRFEWGLTQGMTDEQALLWATDEQHTITTQTPTENNDEQTATLLGQIEAYITQYQLLTPQSSAYIQAFKDAVFSFSCNHQADIFSFLAWWDERADRLTLQATAQEDAVQILTIHKSKGLEFEVVMIPYCDWNVAEKRNDARQKRANILWAKPMPPFDYYGKMPLVPLEMSSALAKTAFAEDYFHELQSLYLDNLNLTYVAFTRAKRELYIYAPQTDYPNKQNKIANVGEMLYRATIDTPDIPATIVVEHSNIQIHSNIQTDSNTFKHSNIQIHSNIQPTIEQSNRPTIKHTNSRTVEQQVGNMMHTLLSLIQQREDEPKAIEQLQQTGIISTEQLPVVQTEMRRFWQLVGDTDWFEQKWQVLNEQDILLPDGMTRRPDRLLICDKQAVIIDYKFGFKEREEYKQQVREYVSLLEQMGYSATAYLCYINLQKIVKVC